MRVEEVKNAAEPEGEHTARLIRPAVHDPSEIARRLKEIVAEMRSNPVPADAPHLTREDFHARG